MGLLIFGIIASIILTAVLAYFGFKDFEWYHILYQILSVILGFATTVILVFFCILSWGWKSAEYETVIINREYGTSYTREEVFYASDVIDTIRELDRSRIEVNGDLMRE